MQHAPQATLQQPCLRPAWRMQRSGAYRRCLHDQSICRALCCVASLWSHVRWLTALGASGLHSPRVVQLHQQHHQEHLQAVDREDGLHQCQVPVQQCWGPPGHMGQVRGAVAWHHCCTCRAACCLPAIPAPAAWRGTPVWPRNRLYLDSSSDGSRIQLCRCMMAPTWCRWLPHLPLPLPAAQHAVHH